MAVTIEYSTNLPENNKTEFAHSYLFVKLSGATDEEQKRVLKALGEFWNVLGESSEFFNQLRETAMKIDKRSNSNNAIETFLSLYAEHNEGFEGMLTHAAPRSGIYLPCPKYFDERRKEILRLARENPSNPRIDELNENLFKDFCEVFGNSLAHNQNLTKNNISMEK